VAISDYTLREQVPPLGLSGMHTPVGGNREDTLWADSGKDLMINFVLVPQVIARLGKEIDNEDSVYYWAQKNGIPVYCPALTDGEFLVTNIDRRQFPGSADSLAVGE